MRYETARRASGLRSASALLQLLGHWTSRRGVEALLDFDRHELTEQQGAEGVGCEESGSVAAASWADLVAHLRREVPLFRELRVALEEGLMPHRCAELRRVFDSAVVATMSNSAVVRLHGAKDVNPAWLDCDVMRRVYGMRTAARVDIAGSARGGPQMTSIRTRRRPDDGCAIKMLRHGVESDSMLATFLKKSSERSVIGELIQVHRVSWISWEGALVWGLKNRACDAWAMLRADLLRLASEADLQAVAAWIRQRATLPSRAAREAAEDSELNPDQIAAVAKALMAADDAASDAPFRLSRATKVLGEAQTQLLALVDAEHPGCCSVFSTLSRLAIVADSVQRIRSSSFAASGSRKGATAALEWQTRILNAKMRSLGARCFDVAAVHRAIAQLQAQCGNQGAQMAHSRHALEAYRKLMRVPPPFDSVEERIVAQTLCKNRNGDWCAPCHAHAAAALVVANLELKSVGAAGGEAHSSNTTHVHDAATAMQEAATVLRRLGDDSAAHAALWAAACALRKHAKSQRAAVAAGAAPAALPPQECALAEQVRLSVYRQIIAYAAARAVRPAMRIFDDSESHEVAASIDPFQLACAYEWLGDVHEAAALEAVERRKAAGEEGDPSAAAVSAKVEENVAKAAEELLTGLLRAQGKRRAKIDVTNVSERILSEFSNALSNFKFAQVVVSVNCGPNHRVVRALEAKVKRVEASSAAYGGAPDTP